LIIINFKYKPGMRAFKTILAVFLTVIVSNLLGRQDILFALIGAFIAMGSTVSNSFVDAKNRIIGTILGAIVGLIFFNIQSGASPYIAIGVSIIIYLCNVFKIDKTIPISCIVFFCVVLKDVNVQDTFSYTIDRIIDTSIGIIISILINIIVFPPNYIKRLNKEKKVFVDAIIKTMDKINDEDEDILSDVDEIEKSFNDLKDYAFEIRDDIKTYKKKYGVHIDDEMALYKNLYENIKDVSKIRYEILKKIETTNGNYDDKEVENLYIVLAYHINKAIIDYNILKGEFIND